MAPAHPHATGVAVYPALFPQGVPFTNSVDIALLIENVKIDFQISLDVVTPKK